MAMTITPHDDTEFETTGRRRKITKFALAGVAVLGVGAALTSAAWTDDVFFGGSADSGALDLEGSLDTVSWFNGDAPGNVNLRIPTFVIGPNSVVTERVYVRNNGELPIKLGTIDPTGTGDLFPDIDLDPNAESASVTATLVGTDDILSINEVAAIDVTVTGNTNWSGSEMQDMSGSIIVHVQGTTNLN